MIRPANERGPVEGTRPPLRRLFKSSRYPALTKHASRWLERLAPALFWPDWTDRDRRILTDTDQADERQGGAA